MQRLAVLLGAVVIGKAVAQGSLVLPFWDARGNQYSTETFGSQIRDKFPGAEPALMLVVTESTETPEFKEQLSNIADMGHQIEEIQLLIAVASVSPAPHDGYWLSEKAAKSLLPEGRSFKLFFIGGAGEVCSETVEPASASEIRLLTMSCTRRREASALFYTLGVRRA
ncbi:hypothetical protein [Thiohalomonas denitrificans]|uniref:Uncharacterized protein n=1 Tax=Thiohalomonas denitrificans TaxID=415747 RepID=A0A1G5PT76_9GAMM|nr:hypothetical protein [Thiohalomonas denitrificans]SCZ52279.1 hypothetical protein SAMN03097708_00715 [Thiohalomonas denitrificans]